MPNIASVLKSEITRIARKEIRTEVEGLKKAASGHRTEIAALKRRAQSLELELKRLQKSMPKREPQPIDEEGQTPRFSGKRLATQRRRLGLSADAVGVLVGASGQAVYNWEAGKARPRASYLPAIAALGSLSKAQAADVVASRQTSK